MSEHALDQRELVIPQKKKSRSLKFKLSERGVIHVDSSDLFTNEVVREQLSAFKKIKITK